MYIHIDLSNDNYVLLIIVIVQQFLSLFTFNIHCTREDTAVYSSWLGGWPDHANHTDMDKGIELQSNTTKGNRRTLPN